MIYHSEKKCRLDANASFKEKINPRALAIEKGNLERS